MAWYYCRIKLKAVKRTHRTAYLFLTQISYLQGVHAVFQKILEYQFLAYTDVCYIQVAGIIVRRYKIKYLPFKRKHALIGSNFVILVIKGYLITVAVVRLVPVLG